MSTKAEDILMKNVFDLLKGDALMYFGFNKKIVAPTRTEQTQLTIQTNFIDNTYLLDDGSIVHLEFQTTASQDDLYRFMVSDAVLANKEKKPIHTIVIYSAEITKALDYLDLGSVYYKVNNHYMIDFDGDMIYTGIVEKIGRGERLSKQDVMSIVLLPIMKSKDDKMTRIVNCIDLSKQIVDISEFYQIRAMLYLIAEKFLSEYEMEKIKEMMGMRFRLAEMWQKDKAVEIAKNLIIEGMNLELIAKATGLAIEELEELKVEVENNVVV